MGTAGCNMALSREPLGKIFQTGMGKASESVGCGNEIEDSIRDKAIKIPSWPLYYSLSENDIRKGFELTMKKSEGYLGDARGALDSLPKNFSHRNFLEFLFLEESSASTRRTLSSNALIASYGSIFPPGLLSSR